MAKIVLESIANNTNYTNRQQSITAIGELSSGNYETVKQLEETAKKTGVGALTLWRIIHDYEHETIRESTYNKIKKAYEDEMFIKILLKNDPALDRNIEEHVTTDQPIQLKRVEFEDLEVGKAYLALNEEELDWDCYIIHTGKGKCFTLQSRERWFLEEEDLIIEGEASCYYDEYFELPEDCQNIEHWTDLEDSKGEGLIVPPENLQDIPAFNPHYKEQNLVKNLRDIMAEFQKAIEVLEEHAVELEFIDCFNVPIEPNFFEKMKVKAIKRVEL
jgi:hypothetical protein